MSRRPIACRTRRMRTSSGVNDGFRPLKGVLVVLLCLGLATQVPANPSGRAVRAGEIRFQQRGDTLRVIQGSQQGIIDWDSFSIASGETTRFSQPNARSATLNRVTGESLSRIDGRLLANGRVFLLNSNGIVIGRDGVVDVAGFAASTLDVSNESFLAGGDLSFRGDSRAAVVNLGSISAFDGDIFLVASTVENSGALSAPRGTVGLAAGNDVLIRESGSERIFVRGASGGKKENGVINKGTVEANVAELKAYGGNVYGMAVKNEGRVAATGVTREGGQIFLRAGGRSPGRPASGGGKVRSTGTLSASRPGEAKGGTIVVDAGPQGETSVGGLVEAGSALGTGGDIVILGESVEVFEDSLIIADGETGGGSIRIGGGLRGEDPEFANAANVSVGNGSLLSSRALGSGNGGMVVVFAEGTLQFAGNLSVAGAAGGSGGFAELSGRREVFIDNLSEQVDLGGANGTAGTLLLDPIDVSIINGANNGVFAGTSITDGSIANFLTNVGNLVITTSGAGGQGDITMASGAAINWSSANSLTLEAERDFIMTAGTMVDSLGAGSFSVLASRSISLDYGALIRVNDGDLNLAANQQVGSTIGNFSGITVDGATVEATGNGVVSLAGRGGTSGGSNIGIKILNNGSVIGGDGSTTILSGTGGSGTGSSNSGIYMTSGGMIGSAGGNVSVTGLAGGSGTGDSVAGVFLEDSLITAGGSGNVLVTGNAATSGVSLSKIGVDVRSTSMITSSGGNVQVDGSGGGSIATSSGAGSGVRVIGDGLITAGGSGAVNVNGAGGAGSNASHQGIFVDGDGFNGSLARIGAANGVTSLTAIAGNDLSHALSIGNGTGGRISTGNGNLINIYTDSLLVGANGTISSSGGLTNLFTRSAGTRIDLGGVDVLTGGPLTLGITDAELDRITAGTLQIGNATSGRIQVSSAISYDHHLSLTTGGGALVEAAITMASDADFSLTAFGITDGTISLTGSASDISASGIGSISLTTVRDISLLAGSSIVTEDGDIMLSANRQGTATSGNFIGVTIAGAAVEIQADGLLTIEGRGGNDMSGAQHGVFIDGSNAAALVRGGVTGTTLIDGLSGASAGGGSYGIGISGAMSEVTTMGSNLNLAGTSFGAGTSGGNTGIVLSDEARINGGGIGDVILTGTGGAGSLSSGISLRSDALLSTALYGDEIFLTGIATAGDSAGIDILSAAITSAAGAITFDGQGAGAGPAISSDVDGSIFGYGSVLLKSSGGNVGMSGTLGASALILRDATAAGDAAYVLDNPANDISTLAAHGTGSSGRLGSLVFRDSNGFEVGTVGGINGIEANGAVELFSGGGGLETLEVNRSITSLGGAINLEGYNLTVRNSAISTTGTGTIDLAAMRALLVESESAISVVNGGLTLAANTAVTPMDGDFSGIEIAGSILTTSGTGSITLTGFGGNNAIGSTSVVDGIRLIDGAQLRSLSGNTSAGGITLDGTGGSGNLPNAGVLMFGSEISSNVGEISLTGQGGDSVSGGGDGIVIDGGSILRSTGVSENSAPVTLNGTGGAIGSGNRGVVMQGAGTKIETLDGSISITGNGGGQSTGDSNRGILINEASLEATGSGGLELIGNGGLGVSQIDGVQMENGALLRVYNGDLSIEGAAGGGLGYGIFATPTSGNLEVTGQGWLYLTGSGMNVAGVKLSNAVVGGAGAGAVVIESLVHDVIVDSAVNAAGTITFDSSRDLITSGAVTSGAEDVEFIGRDVTINGLVSAIYGDISVEIGRGITSPGAGGTGAINADLVHGGALSFLGGAGGEDMLTYAGYSGSPVIFDFDRLSGIESLVGTTFTTDQLNGPAFAGSYLFTGSNVFEVNGVNVSGFENIIGGAEDDLFSFNGGGSISGSVNGGGGIANEISYAGFATGAVLNLEVSASSGILGGFSNIQVFNGSSHIDTVIGLQAASTYQFSAAGLLSVGGFEVSGFDNLFAGPGNDVFVVGPGGGIPGTLNGGAGFDVLNYSGYGAPVSVNLGVLNATGFGGISSLENYIGSPFADTFTGTNGNDTFSINSDNAGNVNGSSLFASFEHLKGGTGADRFLFLNQASVASVDGGIGNDLLEIDDRTLGGTNTYTITAGQISRNPTYLFSGLEGIKLLLGPGNDTVVTRDFGLTQTFDGGAGNDILDMGPGVFLAGSPMPLGSSLIFHTGFEGPLASNTPPGEVLQVQTGNVPQPQQGIDFQVEDRFTSGSGSGMPGQNLLQALSQQGGNAFSAVIAGQAVVLQIDGQQYLFGVPASLDGTFTLPPEDIIALLRENLRADGWTELADALGFNGAMTLINLDGPFPVDHFSPIPPELLPLLAGGLSNDAAGELFAALGMVVFIPITAADGAVSLFAIAVPIDDAIRALLLEQLSEAAFTELSDALEL